MSSSTVPPPAAEGAAVTRPQGAPPRATHPWRRPAHLLALLALIPAVLAVAIGDHLLRQQQDLIGVIASREQQPPLFVPLLDYLHDRVLDKQTWNNLNTQLDAARSTNDAARVAQATYDLDEFAAQKLGTEDYRRRDALLDLVQRFPDSPTSTRGYLELFNSEWHRTLSASYPLYTDKLLALADHLPPKEGLQSLVTLAGTLRYVEATPLETKVLHHLHESYPVSFQTVEAMTRYQSLLPPSDPDRAPLDAALTAFEAHRKALIDRAHWYATFDRARKRDDLPKMEALIGPAILTTNPAPPLPDSFTASAAARLVDPYLRAGRLADASRLRVQLANYDAKDTDEVQTLVEMLLDQEEAAAEAAAATRPSSRPSTPPHVPPPNATPSVGPIIPGVTPAPGSGSTQPRLVTKAVSTVIAPDAMLIGLQKWRGLVQLGRFNDAATVITPLIATGDAKNLKPPVTDETEFAAGRFAKLTPIAFLEPADSTTLPAQLAGQSNVLHASLDGHPMTAALPPLGTHMDLYLTDTTFFVEFSTDEPRNPLPPTTAKKRDQEAFRDDCIELFFNPDRWYDYYYDLVVNTDGVAYDSRATNSAVPGRRTYKFDKNFNLDVKTEPFRTPGRWGVRITLPRKQVFPAGAAAIRFNFRRLRHSDPDKTGRVTQQAYLWSPVRDADPHVELWGWLILRDKK